MAGGLDLLTSTATSSGPLPSVTLPLNRTLVPAQGVQVAFDPAAAGDWPDAVIPSGLPDPSTKPTSATLTLTAARPFTLAESVGMQFVDEPSGAVESSGSWGGAAGGLDPEPGIDYWRATNWDTSTGVYGWSAPYSSGATGSRLYPSSGAGLWHGSSPFDVTFRLERSNWLALGDASYWRMVGYIKRAWQVALDPRPVDEATNLLHFIVPGMGDLTVSQATLGAVNDVPIWVRCSRNGTTRTIARSDDGTNWTTVATATGGTPTDPGVYELLVGGITGSFWNGRANVDGVLSEFTYRINGTIVADIGMNDVSHVTDTSWTATPPGDTITRVGGYLLGGATGTITPTFTFGAADTLADIVLDIPGIRSGETLLEQIELTWAGDRHRRGFGLIR